MGGVLFWLLVVVCVLALVVLFFPVPFRLDFEAGEKGALARLFLYKKLLWTGEKKWKKEEPAKDEKKEDSVKDVKKDADADVDDDDDVDEAYMPTYVATKPVDSNGRQPKAATSKKQEPVKKQEPTEPAKESAPEPVKNAPDSEKKAPEPASAKESAPGKKEKRKLTDEEFWTIVLTPELDARAFRYLKGALLLLVKTLGLQFVDCYVEGIRADYQIMGYGAALNGVLKGFPYLGAWDFRMDWTHERELHAQGAILSRLNLCRVLVLLLMLVYYVGVLLFLFWRRRARYFKTGEMPELGYIRKKILGWIVEE